MLLSDSALAAFNDFLRNNRIQPLQQVVDILVIAEKNNYRRR